MALGALQQVHISVSDLDRSLAFYRDTLGIPFLFRVPGQPMAFLQAGSVRLYLGQPESPRFETHVLLYFTVADIVAEYERLVAAGVDIESPPHLVHRGDEEELWMAFFADPDDQNLAIVESRPVAV